MMSVSAEPNYAGTYNVMLLPDSGGVAGTSLDEAELRELHDQLTIALDRINAKRHEGATT